MRWLVLALLLSLASSAHAEGARWSDASPRARADVLAGRPLVSLVVVPLCDNALINCGSAIAGKPTDLAHNVYWGAAFGQRRFFERKNSGWEKVEISRARTASGRLERAVFRRKISRGPWGGPAGSTTDHYVVLDAYDGAKIDAALADFFAAAARGISVQIGGRTLPVHVVGWAGHNRLMDDVKPPVVAATSSAVPTFVMACESSQYFEAPLAREGSRTLVMTRTLMAPEGYVIDALSRGIGENASSTELRARAVKAYATWQKLTPRQAGSVFAPPKR